MNTMVGTEPVAGGSGGWAQLAIDPARKATTIK
jgi:hypothetical protein